MANENYATGTEVDGSAYLTVASGQLDWNSGADSDATAYLYWDKTAGHFGDFDHIVSGVQNIGTGGGKWTPWMMGNTVGDLNDLKGSSGGCNVEISYKNGNVNVKLNNYFAGSKTTITTSMSNATDYWFRIKRVSTTLSCDIYSSLSDAQNETNVTYSGSITIVTTTMRYVYGIANEGSKNKTGKTYDGQVGGLDLQEGGGAQTLSPTGIASAENVGIHTASPGGVTAMPTGIASSEAIGTAALLPEQILTPSAISSLEAFGTQSISATYVISATGIASAEALGTVLVIAGPVTLTPGGISSLEAVGSHAVSQGAQILSPASAASLEAFGTATMLPTYIITPAGLASDEAVPNPAVTTAYIITPTGVTTTENFGVATVTTATVLTVSGISSLEALGSHIISSGGSFIAPASIASFEAFGSVTVTAGHVIIHPAGISDGEVGTPWVMQQGSGGHKRNYCIGFGIGFRI